MYLYEIKFIDKDGNRIIRRVQARHEFEAVQLAGAWGCILISVINLDL